MIRSLLKAALPPSVVQFVSDLRRVEPRARPTLLRLVLTRWIRQAPPGEAQLRGVRNVVAICHGNILRSAYAEGLLTQWTVASQLRGIHVSSAGLHATPGKRADPRGVDVARENGIDLGAHRATRLSDRIVADADLLLVMDIVNAAEVLSRHPDAAGKVVLLGCFAPERHGDPTIADPYTGDIDAVRVSYRRVGAAANGLVAAMVAAAR